MPPASAGVNRSTHQGATTLKIGTGPCWPPPPRRLKLACIRFRIYMNAYTYAPNGNRLMTRHTDLKPHWFHVLLSLADRELHGTALMEEVLDRTGGQLRLWPGKLYGALRELTNDGLIYEVDAPEGAPTKGGKRRFYAITRRGRLLLHEEVERLAAWVRVARSKSVGSDLEQA